MGTGLPKSGNALSKSRGFAIEEFYISFLAWSLLGYAVLGKGYAYLGVPPLYMGEILLLAGIVVALRSGCLIATTASIPSLILLCLMGWVVIRTASDFPRYGIDSLRDSVVVIYGTFAFIVAALVIRQPGRLDRVVRYYGNFCTWFPILCPLILLYVLSGMQQPSWPFSGQSLLSVRTGELAVHLAGCLAFVLLGFRRVGWLWIICCLASVAVIFAQNRGGMLAIAVAGLLATLMGRNGKQVFQLAFVAAIMCLVVGLAGVSIDVIGGRAVQLDQIMANITSIFGDSTTGNLDGTKLWRMRWWDAIIQYTLHGEYFWYGKGFGPNLAIVDGFIVGLEHGGTPLRSPHNAHLTILARSGVPGLALWVAMILAWLAMLLRNARAASMRGDIAWARFFQWLACYVIAVAIDASFDVALEGPMLGIWFWTLFGLGLGSSLVYWSMYPSRSGIRRHSPAVALTAILFGICIVASATPVSAVEKMHSLSNSEGSCIVIRGRSNVVIENVHIGPCKNHGIEIVDSASVIIKNVTIEGTGEIGIRILASEDITIQGNRFVDTLTGIHVQQSKKAIIDCNSFRNMRGPIPRGQFVQFDKVHSAGMRISCNTGVNEPGMSNPEDAISMYNSSGTPDSPILIERNVISGGGPSTSGGGIMLGDAGGAYLAARDNILQDPGQYGIGVAGGHDIEISGNVIVARQQPFTNVGISVWRQTPGVCEGIVVRNNLVDWKAKTGRPNPWWDARNCGRITGVNTNDFSATQVDIPARHAALSCNC